MFEDFGSEPGDGRVKHEYFETFLALQRFPREVSVVGLFERPLPADDAGDHGSRLVVLGELQAEFFGGRGVSLGDPGEEAGGLEDFEHGFVGRAEVVGAFDRVEFDPGVFQDFKLFDGPLGTCRKYVG
ncbi:hypothetical protein AKJ41_03810 [candidate division MSBL1 archaeon SCGC-AAA259O05]|uniref:Uncharacterized protein n=1 Tax=candidate division MSBL1 archaeon SCGC-AAA259O05 TaxID=1698271 RepID=A0A133V2J1_9EURY|nr:hypothetical protein AKJ41_03810 [candidate division MSBL1 archaeon SCGC-AAA259O05]